MRLSCDQVAEDAGQMELFAPAATQVSQKQSDLQETLDALREKHGRDAIRWGKGVPVRKGAKTFAEPLPDWDPEQTRYQTLTKN